MTAPTEIKKSRSRRKVAEPVPGTVELTVGEVLPAELAVPVPVPVPVAVVEVPVTVEPPVAVETSAEPVPRGRLIMRAAMKYANRYFMVPVYRAGLARFTEHPTRSETQAAERQE